MKSPSPEDRDRFRDGRRERTEAARKQMQEVIDRVETRMAEQRARRERGLLRRLFAR